MSRGLPAARTEPPSFETDEYEKEERPKKTMLQDDVKQKAQENKDAFWSCSPVYAWNGNASTCPLQSSVFFCFFSFPSAFFCPLPSWICISFMFAFFPSCHCFTACPHRSLISLEACRFVRRWVTTGIKPPSVGGGGVGGECGRRQATMNGTGDKLTTRKACVS